MTTFALIGALEAGLLFGLVALGVYLSFRVLNYPDLTVDGSFPLGAAVTAAFIVAGADPVPATLAGAAAGALAGLATAWLHVGLRIMNLLAGILTMVALYSINLRVMGRPNLSLYGEGTVFSPLEASGVPAPWAGPLLILAVVIACKLAVDWFLSTEIGLALRASGENPVMARAHGVSNGRAVVIGMAVSNGLVGLAGALFAQSHGVADISMGTGTIVTGLAALIIGETALRTNTVARATLACLAGAILYRFVIAGALNADLFGLEAQDLNLVTAIVVAVAVVASRARTNGRWRRLRPSASVGVDGIGRSPAPGDAS